MVQYWKNIISADFEKINRDNSIVLLPIAATEQHGRHLPVGTDSMILEALLEKFAKERKCHREMFSLPRRFGLERVMSI